MLFEMATGNFTLKLQEDTENTPLNELTIMLNTVAEKMELLSSQLDYINPHYRYQSLTQATIILDQNCTIKSFSEQVPLLLEYSADKLLEFSFHEILSKHSIPLWEVIIAEVSANKTANATVQFLFITQSQHLVPSYCTVSKLLYSNSIIISSITTILQDFLPATASPKNETNQPDAVLIQNVHTYILKNLENPLPSTNELSKMFNVNEFKLKDTFRHFFHTSIYQFYTEERLKKAYLLILQTNIPLKEIAFISGYNNYINFYKAFKKRFNYSPSELKRENIGDN